MAKIEIKYYQGVGKGYEISTTILPVAGLVVVLSSILENYGKIRYSLDGGKNYSDWESVSDDVIHSLLKINESCHTVLNYVPVNIKNVDNILDKFSGSQNNTIYDKTIFSQFFKSNDLNVINWAVNVLEKLFEPGILPTFVSRNNSEDFSSFFLAITQYFAYIVMYARLFRQLENNEILMKAFIEGWGIVYENVDTLEQRQWLFNNWINEFNKRGTEQIVDTGGVVEGELRRLVGYVKPNEFIFGRLSPQDIGWCLGFSSPTWYGTETVNAVSKGWDYGIDYSEGGVLSEENYPILGSVERKIIDGSYVFQFTGDGIVGISSENDKSKLMEVYYGLDYEVTVWIQALDSRPQNIDFGVQCYDSNLNQITQIRLTDFRETNSFFDNDGYHSPCAVTNVCYRLRGVIYNLKEEKDESLYLNFKDGRPLRFIGDVKYMAPYVIQNRNGDVADIIVYGITVKPLQLPFSQGYLGQKNVIAMYSVIRSSRTQSDIEDFVKRYLVSYKNVVEYKWLPLMERTSRFLTFYIRREIDNAPVKGAVIELNNGFKSETDEMGYLRFDIKLGTEIQYTINAKGVVQNGNVNVNADKRIDIVMNLPMNVEFIILEDESWGKAEVTGSCIPYSDIVLTATPSNGYSFVKWNIPVDNFVSSENPLNYNITDHDLIVQAIFELTSDLIITPETVIIPADSSEQTIKIEANKSWKVLNYSDDWAQLTPSSGEEGITNVNVEITKMNDK